MSTTDSIVPSDESSILPALTTGYGLWSTSSALTMNNFLERGKRNLAKWENDINAVNESKPFKSTTGRILQMSPKQADDILDAYVRGANRLASSKYFVFNGGQMAYLFRKMLGLGDPGGAAWEHYKMFADKKADLSALKNHMLFMTGDNKEAKAAYEGLSDSLKAILGDTKTSVLEKYNQLLNHSDKKGLEYLEKFILGEAKGDPGLVERIGGRSVENFQKLYKKHMKPTLAGLIPMNKGRFGLGLATLALGGTSLYNQLTKQSSSSYLPELSGSAEVNLSSILGGTSGIYTGEMVNKALKEQKLLQILKKNKLGIILGTGLTGLGAAGLAHGIDKLLKEKQNINMLKNTINAEMQLHKAAFFQGVKDNAEQSVDAVKPYLQGEKSSIDLRNDVEKLYDDSKERLEAAIKSKDISPLITNWKQYNAIREGLGMDVSLLDKLKALIY